MYSGRLAQFVRRKVYASVEAGFDTQISRPQNLIRLQSVSGDEDAIQDRVFDEFRNRDYAMESFEMGEVVTARYSGCGPFPDDHLLAWIVVRLHRPR